LIRNLNFLSWITNDKKHRNEREYVSAVWGDADLRIWDSNTEICSARTAFLSVTG